MAYADKYKITYATRGGKTAYLYLQEDGYVGSLIEYQGVNLQLQYIPTSDNPFEPIFASQLNVNIDITNNLSNMPDFTTNNDRKYFAKLFLDSDLEWIGWALSDSVTLDYTTGLKILSFNCTDGLGMLQSIPINIPTSTDTNLNQTILSYILVCLNTLGYPTNPNLFTSCNYYASGMTTRATDPSAETFAQTYLPARTFLQSDYTFLDSLLVLSNILKSFGCRIFMAGGKWNIISINQFANDSGNYTEFDYTGAVVSSGTYNTKSIVQGYGGNTSNVYFINGGQSKIMRKGYNKINALHTYTPAFNYISNGNLRPSVSTNNPYNWLISFVGSTSSITLIDNPNDSSAQFRLFRDNTTGANARVWISSEPLANSEDILDISFNFHGQATIPGPYACAIYLTLTNGSTIYTWDGTNWVTTSGANYKVPNTSLNNPLGVSTFSIKTKPLPVNGKIDFKVQIDLTTDNFIQVSDFVMKITSRLKTIDSYAYIINNKQYVNEVDIPYGIDSYSAYSPSESGVFLNSSGGQLTGWFQYGRPSASFDYMAELLMQSYINIFGKNIINIDGDVTSFNTNNGYLNAKKVFQLTDTDPSQINVANNYYMIGNCTIDYPNDSTKFTLLQISDNTISATINYAYTYNN